MSGRTNPANQKNDSTRQPCPRAGSRVWPARPALKWDRNDNRVFDSDLPAVGPTGQAEAEFQRVGRDRASSCNATSRPLPGPPSTRRRARRSRSHRAAANCPGSRPAVPGRVAGDNWRRRKPEDLGNGQGLSAAWTSPRSPSLGKACPVLSESGTRIERLGRGEARPGLTGCSAAFKSELLLEARTPAGSAFKSESLYPSRRLDPGRSRAERTRISLALSHSLSPSPPALPLAPPCRL